MNVRLWLCRALNHGLYHRKDGSIYCYACHREVA